MSISVNIKKGETITLSQFTVLNHKVIYNLELHSLDGQVQNETSIVLNGKIPSKSKGDKGNEEIDDVKKLLKWSVQSPYNSECYRQVDLVAKNNNNIVVENIHFDEAYVVSYEETFDDEVGVGMFSILIREKVKEIENLVI